MPPIVPHIDDNNNNNCTQRCNSRSFTISSCAANCLLHIRSCGPDAIVCCLFVGCLTSQQHARVSQGWICSHNFTCCHTEIEVADQTFHLTQSHRANQSQQWPYDARRGRVATGAPFCKSLVWLNSGKNPGSWGFEPGIFHSRGGRLNH